MQDLSAERRNAVLKSRFQPVKSSSIFKILGKKIKPHSFSFMPSRCANGIFLIKEEMNEKYSWLVSEIFLIVRYSVFCTPEGKRLAFQVLSQQEKTSCSHATRVSVLRFTTRWKHYNCVCTPTGNRATAKQTSSPGPLTTLCCW